MARSWLRILKGWRYSYFPHARHKSPASPFPLFPPLLSSPVGLSVGGGHTHNHHRHHLSTTRFSLPPWHTRSINLCVPTVWGLLCFWRRGGSLFAFAVVVGYCFDWCSEKCSSLLILEFSEYMTVMPWIVCSEVWQLINMPCFFICFFCQVCKLRWFLEWLCVSGFAEFGIFFLFLFWGRFLLNLVLQFELGRKEWVFSSLQKSKETAPRFGLEFYQSYLFFTCSSLCCFSLSRSYHFFTCDPVTCFCSQIE